MYQQEDLLPSNRNYTLFIGCFTFIFTLVIVLIVASNLNKQPTNKEGISFVPEKTKPQADLTKYNQDSDRDLIPNFIEDEAILNTYLAESSYCEQANPICSGNPLNSEFYISVILDGSTSMNIPATREFSKNQLVKNSISEFLVDLIKQPFIKTQLISFGNKGSVSFIADNESCVSNISFKNFNQIPTNDDIIPQILNNYVANGKSPIIYSLEQVEKSFPNKEGNNLVIIITDGIDDCGVDINTGIRGVLSRGIVKKVNIISLFSPQDEENKLREAVESNGGRFTNSPEILKTLQDWKNDFVYTNWCKYKDLNNVLQCMNNNYQEAFTQLDKQINSKTPDNEQNKIREIKSSIDLLIQNYKNNQNQNLRKEFDDSLESFIEEQ